MHVSYVSLRCFTYVCDYLFDPCFDSPTWVPERPITTNVARRRLKTPDKPRKNCRRTTRHSTKKRTPIYVTLEGETTKRRICTVCSAVLHLLGQTQLRLGQGCLLLEVTCAAARPTAKTFSLKNSPWSRTLLSFLACLYSGAFCHASERRAVRRANRRKLLSSPGAGRVGAIIRWAPRLTRICTTRDDSDNDHERWTSMDSANAIDTVIVAR